MAPAPADVCDINVINRVLELLRQWGWEAGEKSLKAEIEATTDSTAKADLKMLTAWITAERGELAEAETLFVAAQTHPQLNAWALVGRAFIAYSKRTYKEALKLVGEAEAGDCVDPVLKATIDHVRGLVAYQHGQSKEALNSLYGAIKELGLKHFGAGRVLDSLGMVYAGLNDFTTALLFYNHAVKLKNKNDASGPNDRAGLAMTYGQLGRLYLEWDLLDHAEEYFRKDLNLCVLNQHRTGEAQMYNHLGQVDLRRGEPKRAWEYLNQSVDMYHEHGSRVGEAFARKDRAAAKIAMPAPEYAAAEADLNCADELFRAVGTVEGQMHVAMVRGPLLSRQDKYAAGESCLRRAAVWFQEYGSQSNAARAFLELARLCRRGGKVAGSREALFSALKLAEESRRDALVAEVEAELKRVDEAELYRRLYTRARGKGIREAVGPMERATSERATVLFLDLRESTKFVMDQDPAVVRLTLNQLFALLGTALERHHVVINQYLGDGFMALSRGDSHAENAVAGALAALDALGEFNRPRVVLEKDPLAARVGVSTGDVVLGNIGTHQKIDFTAVGPTTNTAARLQGKAEPGLVCISESTFKAVGPRFQYDNPEGRLVELAGIKDPVRVWDVKGRTGG